MRPSSLAGIGDIVTLGPQSVDKEASGNGYRHHGKAEPHALSSEIIELCKLLGS